MTLDEINKMKQRNKAGKCALKFFKDVVHVKSTNLVTSSKWHNSEADYALEFYRKWHDDWIVTQVFEDAARTGVGNCGEKMAICHSSLASNPRISHNSFVTMCKLVHVDHVVVLVTENDIRNKNSFYLRDLSKATMIVDGWTEDYYFPNLSIVNRYRFSLGKTPNPVQLFMRSRVKRDLLVVKYFSFLPEWCLTT